MPRFTKAIAQDNDNMTIRTNGVARDIVEAYELNAQERSDFDYLDWEAIENGNDSRSFVRYRGQLIDLGDVMRCPQPTIDAPAGTVWDTLSREWDGYESDSFFSGLLFKYVDNCERVIVGRYCC